MGATTVWERWDSMLPDGSINPGQMTSFNHYALGAVADWLHRRVAGLAPAAPGYRAIEVRPLATSHLTSASARHLTPYGEAAVSWERSDGRFSLRVTVPVGASATVHVPSEAGAVVVRHGQHEWTVADPVRAEPLPVDATIRQLMDHEPSWNTVVAAALEARVVDADTELAARLERFLDMPASQFVDAATAGGFIPGAEAMRARLEPLLPRLIIPGGTA
jgi:alpha-L-rhamnosidase